MLSGVRLTISFSKYCGKKSIKIQSQVKFSYLSKNWVLCSSINWPSNLVNNVSCKCSVLPHKVRETSLVLGEKEQCLYTKTQVHLNSLFSLCFFQSVAFLDPTTNLLKGLLSKGQAQSSNAVVLLLLFFLKGQKEIHEEVKSWWNGQRGLYWEHSNSYIMVQPTDLFCHAVLIFVKVLAHLLANIEETHIIF